MQIADIHRHSSHSPIRLALSTPEARLTEKKYPTIPRIVGVEISPTISIVTTPIDMAEDD